MKIINRGFAPIELLGVAALVLALGVVVHSANNFKNTKVSANEETRLAVFTVTGDSDIVNEVGGKVAVSGEHWLGNGGSKTESYLGLFLQGEELKKGVFIKKAELKFTQPKEEWIDISFEVSAEDSASPATFSQSQKPSVRRTLGSNSFSDNVKWEKGKTYSYDITSVVKEYFGKYSSNKIALLIKGTGSDWGRKFVYTGSGQAPRLEIEYSIGSTATAAATAKPAQTVTTATATATASAKPTNSGATIPINKPTSPAPAPALTPPSAQIPSQPQGNIYGAVPDGILGECTHKDHDKYVTKGPDGKLYRTWHPQIDPATGCKYAHEHGDNPATSNIYAGPVPFSYIGSNVNIDMPHVGYKCFVHNKGQVNDEGSSAINDSYYCFHMGTAGAGRYTAQFHELYFFLKSAGGYVMKLQGLADSGPLAGTICNEPRLGRTVQGLDCKIDSPYEIWANDLRIRNGGNTVAFAQVSTAVFDPITTMDPADRSRVVYSWDETVQQKTYKYKNDYSYFRGCDREAYSGPVNWYNRGGATVYYTDVYGNVTNGGPLKQEISPINTNANIGYVDQYGALVMAYKSGNKSDTQSQFKYHKSACASGLGINN